MEGTLSEIRLFGPTWAPRNWAHCHGQLMPISSNTALFSLIGTTFPIIISLFSTNVFSGIKPIVDNFL